MSSINKRENQLLIEILLNEMDDNDPEELELDTQNLRNELTEVNEIEKVDFVTNAEKGPEGSKAGGDIAALGSLLVTLGASAGSTVIPSLANTLQSWLTRHERRKISLEIAGDKLEITGVSDEQQQRLIDVWISKHETTR